MSSPRPFFQINANIQQNRSKHASFSARVFVLRVRIGYIDLQDTETSQGIKAIQLPQIIKRRGEAIRRQRLGEV